jgi:hypothetical protein
MSKLNDIIQRDWEKLILWLSFAVLAIWLGVFLFNLGRRERFQASTPTPLRLDSPYDPEQSFAFLGDLPAELDSPLTTHPFSYEIPRTQQSRRKPASPRKPKQKKDQKQDRTQQNASSGTKPETKRNRSKTGKSKPKAPKIATVTRILVYHGILEVGGNQVALLQEETTRRQLFVTTGQQLGEFTVISFTADTLFVRDRVGREHRIRFGTSKKITFKES